MAKKKTTTTRRATVAKAGRRAAPRSPEAFKLAQKAAQAQRKFDESKYEFMRFMQGRMDYIQNLPPVKRQPLNDQQLQACRTAAHGLGKRDASDPFTRRRWLNYFVNGIEDFYSYKQKPSFE
jgi:hypothetical protein